MIIVGLNNPHRDCGALDPKPGTAGDRLWRMSGLSLEQYMKIPRTNLISTSGRIKRGFAGSYADVVLLGCEVWAAFFDKKIAAFRFVEHDTVRYYFVPHPSGLNRYYNKKTNQLKLRRLFADLVNAPVYGERAGSSQATVTGERRRSRARQPAQLSASLKVRHPSGQCASRKTRQPNEPSASWSTRRLVQVSEPKVTTDTRCGRARRLKSGNRYG